MKFSEDEAIKALEVGTEDAIYAAEQKVALLRFDELVDLASEVCLKQPLDLVNKPEITQPETELTSRTLIDQLGARGLRAAIELTGDYIGEALAPSDTQDEDVIRLDTPIKYPYLWEDGLDRGVVDKATAFGEALIAQSFKVLGQDAYEKADQLKKAQTVDEQMAHIMWLHHRLDILAHDGMEDVQSDPFRHLYNPIRLSPKALGTYPNQRTQPTCLGVSILATSFLQRAGLNVLNAGVNISGNEKPISMTFALALDMQSQLQRYNLTIPEPVKKAVDTFAQLTRLTLGKDDAQHVATYTQLIDGQWAQIDPNYDATYIIKETVSGESLTKSAQSLNDFKAVAPNLELSAVLPGFETSSELVLNIIDMQDPAIIDSMRSAAQDLFDGVNDVSPQAILDKIVMPFFTVSHGNNSLKYSQDLLIETDEDDGENIVEFFFHRSFQRYVLWGEQFDAFTSRMQRDPSYRAERIDDVMRLPFMIGMSIAKDESEGGTPWFNHFMVDLGLPAARIGMAVLSDFALYTESELPGSFWMRNWPGNVAVLEHLDLERAGKKGPESKYQTNNLNYYRLHPFTSTKNRGIINEFHDRMSAHK